MSYKFYSTLIVHLQCFTERRAQRSILVTKKTERKRRNAKKKKELSTAVIASATGDAKRILGNGERRKQTGRA